MQRAAQRGPRQGLPDDPSGNQNGCFTAALAEYIHNQRFISLDWFLPKVT